MPDLCYFIQTAATYSSTISNFCGGGEDACTAAVNAFTASVGCSSETTNSDICTGTCRDIYDDIIDNCDAIVSRQL